MIKELTMFTVICDGCGKDVNKDADYSCWDDKLYAQDIAMEADWVTVCGKHYCTDCYYYDEDDKLIIQAKGRSKE